MARIDPTHGGQVTENGGAPESVYELVTEVTSDTRISEEAQENRRKVIAAYEAQVAGDWDTWWDLFDDEVEFREADSLPYSISVKGLDKAKDGVAGMLKAWSRLVFTQHEFAAAGDIVLLYGHMRATSHKTGRVYDNPVIEMFRFKNGKVVEWTAVYYDTHAVREVVGMD
jgi:ketosteroid isomerase-like protein